MKTPVEKTKLGLFQKTESLIIRFIPIRSRGPVPLNLRPKDDHVRSSHSHGPSGLLDEKQNSGSTHRSTTVTSATDPGVRGDKSDLKKVFGPRSGAIPPK